MNESKAKESIKKFMATYYQQHEKEITNNGIVNEEIRKWKEATRRHAMSLRLDEHIS